MNITHAVSEEVVGDKLKAIFARQQELMDKYHEIESRSGLVQTEDCPVNLNDKRGQARLKDFAWRVTEELGEALDAVTDQEHFNEELVDGLHFLTEMSILSGMTPEDIIEKASNIYNFSYEQGVDILEELANLGDKVFDKPEQRSLEYKVTKFVEQLGMTCNCLKNKPWKQSNMLTDVDQFKKRLTNVWVVYIAILSDGMSVDEITDTYLKKSQVNKFRQRSNY
jgi:dimeric dUTPase (all-alpha-NTP-PPase superfamily)